MSPGEHRGVEGGMVVKISVNKVTYMKWMAWVEAVSMEEKD